jgi:hypothetical protein
VHHSVARCDGPRAGARVVVGFHKLNLRVAGFSSLELTHRDDRFDAVTSLS